METKATLLGASLDQLLQGTSRVNRPVTGTFLSRGRVISFIEVNRGN